MMKKNDNITWQDTNTAFYWVLLLNHFPQSTRCIYCYEYSHETLEKTDYCYIALQMSYVDKSQFKSRLANRKS